jgi:hypothetical protein
MRPWRAPIRRGFGLAEPGEPFDAYVNGVQVTAGVWDVVIDLYLRSPASDPPSEHELVSVGRLRMSPQHALVLAQMLQKQMDFYQERVGAIILPDQLLKDLGLSEDADGDE